MGLCPVSAITQEPTENLNSFLETLKEVLQKFINLDLLLEETDDFKGQIPVTVCIRHQDKIITAAAGPCCLFR